MNKRSDGPMKQRGFTGIEIAIAIGAAALLVGAIAGAIHLVTAFIDDTRKEGFDAGVAGTAAAYTARDNQKLATALARVQELEEAARAEESRKQSAVNAAVAVHLKEKTDVEDKHDRLLADVRAGRFSLRDPGAEARSGCPGSGERGGPAVAGDPAGSPGRAGGGELSRPAEEFLLAEARRADIKVKALQLCRAALKAERAAP